MTNKPGAPILPRNKRDPTGVDRLERGAMREFSKRMRRILRAYVDILNRVPAEPVTNRRSAAKDRYTFRLDSTLLTSLLAQAASAVDATLLGDGEHNQWFFETYVSVAYGRGTAQEHANLAQQSPVYRAGYQDAATLMRSDPYRRRMALMRSRVFEEMKGLTGRVKANMARVLTDGIGRGLNPRVIAANLNGQAGIETRRANRLARTEVPMALRRARWDESDDAAETYGLRTMELHLSALSPTTRATHAARHGKLFTREQVRDWYSVDGNAANCKCSQTSVMVDADGKPLVPSIVDRAKQTKKVMEKRDYAWSK